MDATLLMEIDDIIDVLKSECSKNVYGGKKFRKKVEPWGTPDNWAYIHIYFFLPFYKYIIYIIETKSNYKNKDLEMFKCIKDLFYIN